MGTAQGMIDRARKDVNLGEPNYIQAWYRQRNGSEFNGNFSWCQAAVCKWAYDSGNYDAVMFGVDDAYTVTAAKRFKSHDQWYPGTTANVNAAKPGDIVYFDWGNTDSIDAIDHVGIVVEALGNGYVKTIEGNTGDKCLERERHASVIAGLGRPKYSAADSKEADDMPDIYESLGSDRWVGKPKKGQSLYLGFDREYADPNHQHANDGVYPTVLFTPALYNVTVGVTVTGLPKDGFCWIRCVEVDDKPTKDGSFPIRETDATQTIVGRADGGPVYVSYNNTDVMGDKRRLRIQMGGFSHNGVQIKPTSLKLIAWKK